MEVDLIFTYKICRRLKEKVLKRIIDVTFLAIKPGKKFYIILGIHCYLGIYMGEITVLTKATSKGLSLRTTVPHGIVKHFGLKEGDKLSWEIAIVNSELVIIVRPLRGESHG